METGLDVSIRHNQHGLLITRVKSYVLMNTSINLREREREMRKDGEGEIVNEKLLVLAH